MEQMTISELMVTIKENWPALSKQVKDPDKYLLTRTPAELVILARSVLEKTGQTIIKKHF